MTTRTGRQYRTQQTHYLRKRIDYTAASGVQVFIGTLPKGALVHRSHVAVTTAFNASTANQIDIGTIATPAALVANTSVTAGTIGAADIQPATLAGLIAPTGEADLYVRYTQSGTAATAGVAYVVIEFSPDNDG